MLGCLTGPTAVGKTEVGLLLAESRGWAILSVDSRAIYRRLEIGTAKPTPEERARVPHLLLDALDPTEACSAGRFRALAGLALSAAAAEGKRVLAVGGAGLYWEALTRGLHLLPASDPEIRARHAGIVREEGPEGLYRRLLELDPVRAAQLAPRDRQRVGRALEVAELAGRPMSRILRDQEREGAAPAASGTPPVIVLLRPREDLYRRIERRCRAMVEAGLVAELRSLLDAGISPEAPGLRTVGYREFLPHLLQRVPLESCLERFLADSRRYAKRQETWLRHRLPERREFHLEEGEAPPRTAARILESGILQGS
jgi:tRNA dimethylallyltransferase